MVQTDKITRLAERAGAKSAKRARKKDELADHAITTLRALGYARTSLRDIAELSGVAVGTLHYYFEDKVDLITYCVRRYKIGFVDEMQSTLESDVGADQLAERFIRGLALSIRRNAETHRLWYDIRNQAMFDPAFVEVVAEIEDSLMALVLTLLDRMGQPREKAVTVFLMMDAVFRHHLQRYLEGDDTAPAEFETHVAEVLKVLL